MLEKRPYAVLAAEPAESAQPGRYSVVDAFDTRLEAVECAQKLARHQIKEGSWAEVHVHVVRLEQTVIATKEVVIKTDVYVVGLDGKLSLPGYFSGPVEDKSPTVT